MDINSISSVTANYQQTTQTSNKTAKTETASSTFSNTAAVYEKSTNTNTSAGTYKIDHAAIVAQMKADSEARLNSLMDMVRNTIAGQGNTLATSDDVWKFLASGDYTVDAETKAAAQEAISEDGYWGVKQTSARIVDFAKALAGGDSSKADELLEAFKKGFEEATKTWGKDLPSICSDTYDAVIEGFNSWKTE